ncbi:universal stress protein [Kitasatospora mediocidica]|uniref:universal stress protein n=1 Tax=Kitasatospora mediocidica TaxID=58352 RepID=UPI0007C6AC25|nr:universal stress protein [Kitasatospora mediocidica]
MEFDKATERRIVVGVDGSPSSEAALRWAIAQAGLRGAAVEALTSWEYPATIGWSIPMTVDTDFGALAGKVLSECVSKAAGPDRTVEIREHVVQGNAAQALVAAAHGAELLVVGNRGHGGFTEALLGSVSQRCVHHATCPVVVVRDDEN